jgi:hypothetical protein
MSTARVFFGKNFPIIASIQISALWTSLPSFVDATLPRYSPLRHASLSASRQCLHSLLISALKFSAAELARFFE